MKVIPKDIMERMNKFANEYGTTFVLNSHDKIIIGEFVKYLKKNFRIGVNTIDDVVKEFKDSGYKQCKYCDYLDKQNCSLL